MEFLDSPEQVEVRAGEQARLHCDFRSSSVPVACCWIYNRDKVTCYMHYKNHHGCIKDLTCTSTLPAPQVVVGGKRISVSSSETQSSVELSQACPADAGSYTIIVRNRQGTAQHTVSLSVIGEDSL